MTTITYPNSKLVFLDASGNTGTTILPESITTPSITVSSITDSNGSTGASGYVLSSTGDGIQWIPSSGNSGSNNDLDMNNNDITNVNTLTTTNVSATNLNISTFTNQVTFNTQPTCSVLPTESNHLVTKEYADTFSTSPVNFPYNLYLNLSQPRTVIGTTGYTGFVGNTGITGYTLSNTLTSTPLGSTGPNITLTFTTATINTNILVATFISNPINITSIPDSLWNLNLYSALNNTTGKPIFTFTLELYRENNTYITLNNIVPTGNQEDMSTTPILLPSIYTIKLRILKTITLPTDRLVLKLYCNTNNTSPTITTYFENNYYSHLSVFLNNIVFSDILDNTSNLITNTITSDNDISINVPKGTLTIGPTASTINISGSTGNIYLFSEKMNGLININKPVVPLYTISPSSGQIGEFISISPPVTQYFPLGLTGQTSNTLQLASYTLPYKGTYYTSASVGVNSTTAIGTLDSMILEISTASTMSGRQDVVGPLPGQTGTNNVIHSSCIINDTNLSTVTLQMTLTYTGLNAQYTTPSSDFFVWNFVRLS